MIDVEQTVHNDDVYDFAIDDLVVDDDDDDFEYDGHYPHPEMMIPLMALEMLMISSDDYFE
jgi:hypothetical protein